MAEVEEIELMLRTIFAGLKDLSILTNHSSKESLGKMRFIRKFFIAIVLSSIVYLNSQNSFAGKTENVSFGDFFGSSEPYDGLIAIAQDQNFFAQNGINLTITDYPTATYALNAALNNQVDFAISSEYSFVATNAINQGNLRIVATIDKADAAIIVARTDKGINNITDLNGKKIGLTFQIISQFYLSRFLELNKINSQNVTLVNLAPADYVNAIVNGTVDAIITTKSYLAPIEDQLPTDIIEGSVQNGQQLDVVLSCQNNWITANPELVKRFLKALNQAETYLVNNPSKAEAIVQKQLNVTGTLGAEIWSDHQFSLSLDQSLIASMQDEAQWLIQNNLTNSTAIPNFQNYIYVTGLEAVNPEAVNIAG